MNQSITIGAASLLGLCATALGQSIVSFNFDNAPVYAPLPISVVSGGVTANLSATGPGYSIQSTSTAAVVPLGFSGHFVYPSSINLADLIIGFSQTVTGFSILYSPQELGCDDSATMRVTAYMNTVLVGTHTTTAANPGTWPTETLACTFPQGFNRVVIHYDAPPPTCQDYGTIFLADDMTITLAPPGSYIPFGSGCLGSGGVPALVPAAPPRIAQVSVLTVQNPPANFQVGLGVLGFSNTMSGGSPLPAELAFLGMPGCWLHVASDTLWLFTPQAAGAQWTFLIPATPGLVGLHFYVQALLIDPLVPDPANTLRAVMTNALAGVIGQ